MNNQSFEELVERLESNPNDDYWSKYLMNPKRNESIELLTEKWFQLSTSVPVVSLTLIASWTKSSKVVDEIIKRAESIQGSEEFVGTLYFNLLRNEICHQEKYRSKVLSLARNWLNNYPDHQEAGCVHGELVELTNSERDVVSAKNWYLKNIDGNDNWRVLTALIRARADSEAIESAKNILRSGEGITPLILAILEIEKDMEIAELAKSAYFEHKDVRLLGKLLELFPKDEKLIAANRDFS